jgi:hypothetical protein
MIAVFAPIPNASVNVTTSVNDGERPSVGAA